MQTSYSIELIKEPVSALKHISLELLYAHLHHLQGIIKNTTSEHLPYNKVSDYYTKLLFLLIILYHKYRAWAFWGKGCFWHLLRCLQPKTNDSQMLSKKT